LPSTGNPVLDVTAIVLLAVGLAALAVQRLRFRRRII